MEGNYDDEFGRVKRIKKKKVEYKVKNVEKYEKKL